MKILMVLTSNAQLGNTEDKTGYWLEEFAAPYFVFRDAGATITLASPEGGLPPVDPRSDPADSQSDAARRLRDDSLAQTSLSSTLKLRDIEADDFDGAFYPGGHGPLWDLTNDNSSIRLLQKMIEAGKPVGLVCHAPGVLRHAQTPEGRSVIEGKSVTGFSNTEEEAMGLSGVVPFLVEDMLVRFGGKYTKAENFEPHVVSDGALVTGQNPASSELAAKVMLEKLSFFSASNFVRAIPWNTAS